MTSRASIGYTTHIVMQYSIRSLRKYMNYGIKLIAKDSWQQLVLNVDIKSTMGKKRHSRCTEQQRQQMSVAKRPDRGRNFSVLFMDQLHQDHRECFKSQRYVGFTSKSIDPESLEVDKTWLLQASQSICRQDKVENHYIEMREHRQVTGILT